jgi:hypothetical protein
VAEWEEIAAFLRARYTIEHAWPGQGVVISWNGTLRPFRMLVARNNPGWAAVEHVTIQAALGPVDQVNLLAALKCGEQLMGGLVCANDTVSIRESRCLSTLSVEDLDNTIGYIGGTLEAYHLAA